MIHFVPRHSFGNCLWNSFGNTYLKKSFRNFPEIPPRKTIELNFKNSIRKSQILRKFLREYLHKFLKQILQTFTHQYHREILPDFRYKILQGIPKKVFTNFLKNNCPRLPLFLKKLLQKISEKNSPRISIENFLTISMRSPRWSFRIFSQKLLLGIVKTPTEIYLKASPEIYSWDL